MTLIAEAHDVPHRPPHSYELNFPNLSIEGDREVSSYSHRSSQDECCNLNQ